MRLDFGSSILGQGHLVIIDSINKYIDFSYHIAFLSLKNHRVLKNIGF